MAVEWWHGIQVKPKELTKTFMIILIVKKAFGLYKNISVLKGLLPKALMSTR